MIIINKEMLSEMENDRAISVKVNLLEEEADYLYKSLPNKGYLAVMVEETKQIISCEVLGVAKAETEPKLFDAGFQTLYLRIWNPVFQANIKTNVLAEAILKGMSDIFSQEGVVK